MQNSDIYKGAINLTNHNGETIEQLSIHWYNKPVVDGYLELDNIGLKTLEGGCPKEIQGYFTCTQNKLSNLIGGPEIVSLSYMAGGNPLISLEGAPLICGEFYIDNCRQITSLEGIGKNFIKQCRNLVINNCPITNNILGIFLIKDLNSVFLNYHHPNNNWYEYPKEIVNIIKQGVSNKTDILEIQEELITKGFTSYAKL